MGQRSNTPRAARAGRIAGRSAASDLIRNSIAESKRGVALFPTLKFKLQRELHLPGILRAWDYSEVRSSENPAGEIEIGMIEQIVGVHAKLQVHCLAQLPLLLQRDIQVDEPGPEYVVARGVSESECGR